MKRWLSNLFNIELKTRLEHYTFFNHYIRPQIFNLLVFYRLQKAFISIPDSVIGVIVLSLVLHLNFIFKDVFSPLEAEYD